MAGATGIGHGNDYLLADHESVYISSSKLLAMTAIDLLYDGAAAAKDVLEKTKLKMSKDEYLEFQRALNATEQYQGAAN